MAETFQFKLVTPTGVLFDGAVEQVTAVGALGEFGVLPLHTNFITSLVPGILTLKIGEASYIEFLLAGGLAEVKDGVMTILALEADAPGTVDSAAAAGEVVSAEVRLAQMSMFDPGYEDAAQALAVARVRAQVNQLLRAPH
ncbi:MAG: ATP synthase F1 subunit epsilon [Candidatus Binataceae bacterium]|jgi:F-type H+-transporting ATPase subunit epsilon